MGIGALECVERGLKAYAQQATGFIEVVVGGAGQQVNEAGIAPEQRTHRLFEVGAIHPEAQLDTVNQFAVRIEQRVDLERGDARIDGRIAELRGMRSVAGGLADRIDGHRTGHTHNMGRPIVRFSALAAHLEMTSDQVEFAVG